MPVAYVCKRCGFILHVHEAPGNGEPYDGRHMPTPSELIHVYDGRCPCCGKPLERPSLEDVRIVALGRRARELLLALGDGLETTVKELGDRYWKSVAQLARNGLVEVVEGEVRLTPLGRLCASILAKEYDDRLVEIVVKRLQTMRMTPEIVRMGWKYYRLMVQGKYKGKRGRVLRRVDVSGQGRR